MYIGGIEVIIYKNLYDNKNIEIIASKGKAISSKITKESSIKPKYEGHGLLYIGEQERFLWPL